MKERVLGKEKVKSKRFMAFGRDISPSAMRYAAVQRDMACGRDMPLRGVRKRCPLGGRYRAFGRDVPWCSAIWPSAARCRFAA